MLTAVHDCGRLCRRPNIPCRHASASGAQRRALPWRHERPGMRQAAASSKLVPPPLPPHAHPATDASAVGRQPDTAKQPAAGAAPPATDASSATENGSRDAARTVQLERAARALAVRSLELDNRSLLLDARAARLSLLERRSTHLPSNPPAPAAATAASAGYSCVDEHALQVRARTLMARERASDERERDADARAEAQVRALAGRAADLERKEREADQRVRAAEERARRVAEDVREQGMVITAEREHFWARARTERAEAEKEAENAKMELERMQASVVYAAADARKCVEAIAAAAEALRLHAGGQTHDPAADAARLVASAEAATASMRMHLCALPEPPAPPPPPPPPPAPTSFVWEGVRDLVGSISGGRLGEHAPQKRLRAPAASTTVGGLCPRTLAGASDQLAATCPSAPPFDVRGLPPHGLGGVKGGGEVGGASAANGGGVIRANGGADAADDNLGDVGEAKAAVSDGTLSGPGVKAGCVLF